MHLIINISRACSVSKLEYSYAISSYGWASEEAGMWKAEDNKIKYSSLNCPMYKEGFAKSQAAGA